MSSLDEMNAALEERRAGEEETLAKGTPPLPFVPMAQPPSGPLSAPVQTIAEPEGFLETFRRGFFDPGWLLDRVGGDVSDNFFKFGTDRNIFSSMREAGTSAAEWVEETVTHERAEKRLAEQNVDVRQAGLTDIQGDAVRSLQTQTANILSMNDNDPDFASKTLNGILSAKFNKIEQDIGSDTRYAPSQFQVAVDTQTGRLLFTHPVTQQRTPIDSFAVTSEDFTDIMERVKPFLWEAGLGVAGTAIGGGGAALVTRNPAVAGRAATVMGGLGEIFGAVFAKYDQRASALRFAGYRPVRWNKEEGREDASAPLRWMFYNAGAGLDGRNEPFPEPRKKSYLDTDIFLEGAETAAAYALGGQVAMKGLYGLYRITHRGGAAKELGDIASTRDFEKALARRKIEVGEGEVLKQSLNTPQTMFNYASHLSKQASEEATKGNTRRARKLREEAAYYRGIGDDYNSRLDDLGVSATGQATANIDQAGVEQIRNITGVDPDLAIPLSASSDVVDEQLIGVGRRVINTVAQSDARAVATNLQTIHGSVSALKQKLMEHGRQMRGGPEGSGADSTLDTLSSQAPYDQLRQAFDDTKAFLTGGNDSYFSTKVFAPANKALQDVVGNQNITIKVPDTIRRQRAKLLQGRINPDKGLSDFIKRISVDINLPMPEKVGRGVRFKKPGEGAGYYKREEIEVTANLSDVSSMIKEIRQLKSNLNNSKNPNDMRLASDVERSLIDLRKRLVYGSPKYLQGSQSSQAAIRESLGGLQKADGLYREAMALYSKGRVNTAMNVANQQPVGPTNQRATSFFEALIPPNSSPDDVGLLLNSWNRSDIGLRAADDIAAEDLLRSGLYQTYLNKVVGNATIDDAIADEGLKGVKNIANFDMNAHKKFMEEYGPVLRSLTPARGNRTGEQVFQDLNDQPAELYRVVRDNLVTGQKLEQALAKSSRLKELGIDPTRPDIAVSDILTTAPENYGALRELVAGLEIPKGEKTRLLGDMDESVKAMFVRMITDRSPGRGVNIDPTRLQEALLRVRVGGEEGFRFRSALEVVYDEKELVQMGKIAQGLEVLNQSARSGSGLPDLKGTMLDSRKPFGAIARVYVGVLNTRARALTAAQRLLGGKTERVLLKALTDPEEAQKLLKGTIPKAGFFGRSLINLVGATTGVYYSQEEAAEIERFSKLEPGDISRERMGGPKPPVDRDRTTNYRNLTTPMKIPSFEIPSGDVLGEIPVVGSYVAPLVGQAPATITAPESVQKGLGSLQQKGVDWLRDIERNKLAGIPAPFNKGGIVNVRRGRQTVM